MIVLDGIQFKLFVKMFCHDKFLLQYDTFIVSLSDGMKSSQFDLYYLYSNTRIPENYISEMESGKYIELDCPHYVHDYEYRRISEESKSFLSD